MTHPEKIEALKAMLAVGRFHHSTHRHNGPALGHGLYIYEKDDNGFNGFRLAMSFWDGNSYVNGRNAEAASLEEEAYQLVRTTGICSGSYANGG